jgi:hypothetical protein
VLVFPDNTVKLCDFGLATSDVSDVMEVLLSSLSLSTIALSDQTVYGP